MLVQLIFTLITFFQLLYSHVRCSIHRTVTCCSNKLIMHKYKNMTSEIYVPRDFHVAWTQQPEQLSSLMRSSSKKCKKKKKDQPVTSWKTISVRRLSRVRTDGLSWGRETVSCESFSPSSHGCILPLFFCAFYQFSSFQEWKVYMVHYTLETIRDSLRMNEEDHLNHLVRPGSVTDHTFIQFYG